MENKTENIIGIIDIETTSLQKDKGSIVEIGIVSLNLDTAEILFLYDNVVHEKHTTPSECNNSWVVKNTNLTTNDIRKGYKLKDEKAKIQKVIDSLPLGMTAFNNTFDFTWMTDRGFTFPKKIDCLMKLSFPICKIPPTEKMKRSGFGGNYKTPSTQEAYNHFFPESDYVEIHRGGDDAYHEAQIAYKLYQLGVFKV